jgi:fructose 1,6-bisphosphate aldolase/phosphatase
MPHRLPPEEMEYTTLPKVLSTLKSIQAEDYDKDRLRYLREASAPRHEVTGGGAD